MEDYDRIYEIPFLPNAIKDAVENQKLAIFIGAGASQIIGCSSWSDLSNNLIKRCLNTKDKNDNPCINYKNADIISKLNDNKKIITICHKILMDNSLKAVFEDEFNKSLKADSDLLRTKNIYNEIWGLHGVFITTNADDHFHNKFIDSQRHYKVEEFVPSKTKNLINQLYQIHGFKDDVNSLVFTVPQYINRYRDERFTNFLEQIFKNYTVLFIGYGLSEFELLDILISKFDTKVKLSELNKFMLQGYFRDDIDRLKFDQYYYNSMGIKVLGYEKDDNGKDQLYNVIKFWNEEVNKTSTYTLDSMIEIDNLLDSL